MARARAGARGLGNVSFLEGDPADMRFERPFDAIVGRFVLQFQNDPAAMLRGLAKDIKPGGTIVFHELDWGGVGSFPAVPTYDLCCRWVSETIRLLGAELRMGIKLHSAFVRAGLPAPTMRLEALIGGGEDAADRLHLVADVAATLLSDMERLGVATAAEVGIDTLVDQMLAEATSTGSAVVHMSQVGAWCQMP
jgi:SAM-dependent methyltransferase